MSGIQPFDELSEHDQIVTLTFVSGGIVFIFSLLLFLLILFIYLIYSCCTRGYRKLPEIDDIFKLPNATTHTSLSELANSSLEKQKETPSCRFARTILWAGLHFTLWCWILSLCWLIQMCVVWNIFHFAVGIVINLFLLIPTWTFTFPPSMFNVIPILLARKQPLASSSSTSKRIVLMRWLVNAQLKRKLVGGCMFAVNKKRGDNIPAKKIARYTVTTGLFYGMMVLMVIVVVVCCVFTWDVCFDYAPGQTSSRVTRMLKAPTCSESPGPPCFVYLTFTEDPTHEMIINFHTRYEYQDSVPRVYFDVVSHKHTLEKLNITQALENAGNAKQNPDFGREILSKLYAFSAIGNSFQFDGLEITKFVHFTELTKLRPDTTYYFIAGGLRDPDENDAGAAYYTVERSFRTLPATSKKSIKFATGGDVGLTSDSKKFFSLIADLGAEFLVVGGDIAYATTNPACYRRWDEWFIEWSTRAIRRNTVTNEERMVPIVAAIGNSESGWLEPTAPFYSRYFPQKKGLSDVDWKDRPTYGSFKLNNDTLLVALDSGHVSGITDQTDWLEQKLNSSSAINKMAVYHVAMYPSSSVFRSSRAADMRAQWQPLFDKYGIRVAFENHYSAYKRTVMIKDDKNVGRPYSKTNTNPDLENTTLPGTLYVGDGCMGVSPLSVENSDAWYMDNSDSLSHVVLVNITYDKIYMEMVDVDGNVFDYVQLTLR